MSSALQIANLQKIEIPWHRRVEDVAIGKDVLELLSSSMYVDPLSVYREYVQNAADAIDEAKACGLLSSQDPGKVELYFDSENRALRIRDNGIGIASSEFDRRMTGFGGSKKRGTTARGFRGVGRLAGIGYCQELIFRSRASGEAQVSELRWDCRAIKSTLRSTEFTGDLNELVRQVVTSRRIDGRGAPDHFFEVELRGIVRQRNDALLDPRAIENYLAQTAPLPFSPTFTWGQQIVTETEAQLGLSSLELHIHGIGQIYRPHQNVLNVGEKVPDSFSDIEFVRVPTLDGAIGAIGWILHHKYKGAVPFASSVRGLRLRVGNIQVGEGNLLEELFTEPRFNSWSVGEIHILDPRVIPNGRRDQFEQNGHFLNLLNHLTPIAREISRRCRTSSATRNWLRQYDRHRLVVREKLAILKQGSLSPARKSRLMTEARDSIAQMERIASKEALQQEFGVPLAQSLGRARSTLNKVGVARYKNPLSRMRGPKRKAYEQVIDLIYDCSSSQTAAKALVDRILLKLK